MGVVAGLRAPRWRRAARATLGCGLLLLGCWSCAALASALAPAPWQTRAGRLAVCVLAVLGAATLFLAVTSSAEQRDEAPAARSRRALAGLGRLLHVAGGFRPELWLLVLLPLAMRHTALTTMQWRLLLVAATLGGALRAGRALTSTRAFAGFTFVLALGICVSYLVVGAGLLGSTNNDAAYYFGVARHIAESGRFEEPIVWNFVVRPASVTHTPFDYWPAWPSLVLVPVFELFGSSGRVLGLTSAAVSSLSVLLFWYLISVARPLRSAWLQITSLLLFAYSPALWAYRFDAETVPWTHVFILAASIALVRRRAALCAVFSFAIFLARPDTLALTIVFWACAGVCAFKDQRLRSWLLACTLSLSAYAAFQFCLFGSPTPPGARLAPWLLEPLELYRYRAAGPLLSSLAERMSAAYFEARATAGFEALRSGQFVPYYHLWLLCGLAGGAWALLRSDACAVAAWLALPLGVLVPSWLSPSVFAFWRTLHPLLPILLLSGVFTLDAAFVAAGERWRGLLVVRRLTPAFASAASCALALEMLHGVQPYLAPPAPPAYGAAFSGLAAHLDDGAVMSQAPWFVLSSTRRPALLLPMNGADAVLAVLERYRPRWLILSTDGNCGESSAEFCRELVAGTRTSLGAYSFSSEAVLEGQQLFKIEPSVAPLRSLSAGGDVAANQRARESASRGAAARPSRAAL